MPDELSDRQIKHRMLEFLKADADSSFELYEVMNAVKIYDEDRIIYLLDEMKEDGCIGMKDHSTKEGRNYLIWIEPKGIGYYVKLEYLKEKPLTHPFSVGQIGDVIHGIKVQDSELSDSPITHKVTPTPNANDKTHKNIIWYKKPLFKYFIIPVLVALVAALLIYLISHLKFVP